MRQTALVACVLTLCLTVNSYGGEKLFRYVYPDNDKLDSFGTGTKAKTRDRGIQFDSAYATYLEVRNSVKEGRLDDGRKALDALWAKYPRGDKVWNKIFVRDRRNTADGTDFGRIPFYLSLIFYEDIIQWRQQNKVFKRKADKKIDLLIMLVNEHHCKVDKEGISPITKVSRLDPRIREDDYRPIRTAFSDFDEIVFYLTEGEYNLRLNVLEHKKPLTATVGERIHKDGRFPVVHPLQMRQLIQQYTPKHKPDWLYLMYPLDWHFENQMRSEGVTLVPGGMGGWAKGLPSLRGTIEKILYSRSGNKDLMSSDERIAWITVWLIHEYMHNVYALNKDLNLEETPHIYYNRKTWPEDFVGFDHFDYYAESIKKRILQPGRKRLHEVWTK